MSAINSDDHSYFADRVESCYALHAKDRQKLTNTWTHTSAPSPIDEGLREQIRWLPTFFCSMFMELNSPQVLVTHFHQCFCKQGYINIFITACTKKRKKNGYTAVLYLRLKKIMSFDVTDVLRTSITAHGILSAFVTEFSKCMCAFSLFHSLFCQFYQ